MAWKIYHEINSCSFLSWCYRNREDEGSRRLIPTWCACKTLHFVLLPPSSPKWRGTQRRVAPFTL